MKRFRVYFSRSQETSTEVMAESEDEAYDKVMDGLQPSDSEARLAFNSPWNYEGVDEITD